MDTFNTTQHDEGYSEDPLNPTVPSQSRKVMGFAETALLADSSRSELPAWLLRNISSLSISDKTRLVVALLDDLPTSVLFDIVRELDPRLYIDFVKYLPAEICVKILGYLDPLSLISVARSCHAWYELALDRTLWHKLYFLEGWKVIPAEIAAWEDKVNRGLDVSAGQLQRFRSSEEGHTIKKRAISSSPILVPDEDHVMVDAQRVIRQEPQEMDIGSSLFGGTSTGTPRSGMTPGIGDLRMDSLGSSWGPKIDVKGKGKAKAISTTSSSKADSLNTFSRLIRTDSLPDMLPSGTLARSTLWMWDANSSRYRLNWKYLYSMRRRLESNWEHGRFKNFQFPHPNHPEEGHSECIYSVQFDAQHLVSGSRDKTLRIWDMQTRRLVRKPLTGHRGSVLCLQFDSDPEEDIIVSGSSDSDVIVWQFSTGRIVQRLNRAHRESVLNIKFDKNVLVTCSKDKSIKVFNRRPLKPDDLGYGEYVVDPVPVQLRDAGYDPVAQLPLKPAYTLLGSLDGHGAAVNAVQICGREVVSASGDRNLKIWDWPNQTCLRTFLGHSKGIACVQYDGKRIVSGSSDNEVKVFDRQSGVEVASLRSHSALVRTVQAGFGDMPFSTEEDAAEAARVDAAYYKAVEAGVIEASVSYRRNHQTGNAGSSRPEDLTSIGAKLPPGGGGGRYGRIVSGSYDATIIIWRRDNEGVWRAQHHLRQEDAAAAAAPRRLRVSGPADPPAAGTSVPAVTTAPTATSSGVPPQAPASLVAIPDNVPIITDAPSSPQQTASISRLIDLFVPQGVHMLQQALATYPAMLTLQSHLQSAIDRETSPFVRSQLRQAVSAAMVRTQIVQQRRAGTASAVPSISNLVSGPLGGGGGGSSGSGDSGTLVGEPSSSHPGPSAIAEGGSGASGAQDEAHAGTTTTTQAAPAAPAPTPATVTGAPPPTGQHAARLVHPHVANDAANTARVFKLQFDARRIICCSQTSVIVGWDFCNGDDELEESARFFATVE